MRLPDLLQETLTPEVRIRWAVEFAQADLTGLRAGDWLNLADDMRRFCGEMALLPSVDMDPPSIPQGNALRDAAARFQQASRHLLDTVLAAQDGHTSASLTPTPVATKLVFQLADGRLVRRASMELVDVMVLLLASAFDAEPLDRVRRCPECGRLFARVRRQTHCSRECINRWTSRRYRERVAGSSSKAKSRKTRRARLEKGQIGHASQRGPAPEG